MGRRRTNCGRVTARCIRHCVKGLCTWIVEAFAGTVLPLPFVAIFLAFLPPPHAPTCKEETLWDKCVNFFFFFISFASSI